MINHPLFNLEGEDSKKDIVFINIRRFLPGNKIETLTNQWEPEQLQTPLDVFEAVGGVEGSYELIGRGGKQQVLARERITIKAPTGYIPPAPPPQQPQQPQQATMGPAVPMMQAGGLAIPANMDPNTAMIISMMAMNNQQANAQLLAQRQDAAAANQNAIAQSQNMMQMMLGMQQNTTALMTGMFGALAPVLGNRPAGTEGSEAAKSGFLQGIEIMAALKQGVDEAAGKQGTVDWATVSSNIMQGLKSLGEIVKTTAGTPGQPKVPPGAPPGVPPGAPQ